MTFTSVCGFTTVSIAYVTLRILSGLVAIGLSSAYTCGGDARIWLLVYGIYTGFAMLVWGIQYSGKYPWIVERLERILGTFGLIWLLLGMVLVYDTHETCPQLWLGFSIIVQLMFCVTMTIWIIECYRRRIKPSTDVPVAVEGDHGV
jgi:hypothetical protein